MQSPDTDEMDRMRSIMFAVIVDIQSRRKNLAQRLFWLAGSTIGISYPTFTSTTSKTIDRSYLPTGSLHKAPEYMNLPNFDPGQRSLFKIHTHVTAQGSSSSISTALPLHPCHSPLNSVRISILTPPPQLEKSSVTNTPSSLPHQSGSTITSRNHPVLAPTSTGRRL